MNLSVGVVLTLIPFSLFVLANHLLLLTHDPRPSCSKYKLIVRTGEVLVKLVHKMKCSNYFFLKQIVRRF